MSGMYLVQKNQIRKQSKQTYQVLRTLTHFSKSLYNRTLWTVRENFDRNNEYLGYLEAYRELKDDMCYRRLPSQVAQQTMKVLNRSYRSFFKLLKKKQKGECEKEVSLPGYLPKDGHFLCIFPKDQFKVLGKRKVRLSLGRYFRKAYGVRYLYFKLPPHVQGQKNRLKEIRLIPRYGARYFEIEYVYTTEQVCLELELDPTKYLSIDLGLNNFATGISSTRAAFILEGRGLKSFNQWWNKNKSNLQSIYDQ